MASKKKNKDLAAYVVRVFAPHPVPEPFQTTQAFAYVDEEGAVWPFGDDKFPEPDGEALPWMFRDDPGLRARLEPCLFEFLQGNGGFIYAFWSYDGRPMTKAPVVYLDDEGTGNTVVANDLGEFLQIAAVGFQRIKPEAMEWDLGPEGRLPGKVEKFFSERGITRAKDPLGLVKAARANHPDFEAWLEDLRAGPGDTH